MQSVRTLLAGNRQLLVGLLIGALVAAWFMPVRSGTAQGRDPVPQKIASAPQSERMERDHDVAAMLREVDDDRLEDSLTELVSFGTRNTLSPQDDPDRGIGAARDWIYDEFSEIAETADGRMDVELQSFDQNFGGQSVEITNVVATLHGTQDESADRIYLTGAHYDSRCSGAFDGECDAPGANDDGSGVVGMIEAARVMAPYERDATVVFVAFAGEEQGLYGSTHFAEQAVENDLDIAGVLNVDMIGNSVGGEGISEPRRVRVFSEGVPWDESPQEASTRRSVGGENDGPSRQLARYIDTAAITYTPEMDVWMINRQDRFGRGGDQRPFIQRGFPGVRFTEPYENYEQQHQTIREEDGIVYGDLLEFVDFDYMARAVKVNVASLASIANAPAVPEDAGIRTFGVDRYNTTVTWDANTEPDLAGYEIVWRDSTSPVWTDYESFPADATSGEVEHLSKDNHQIGVRAVDADGNKSPVALAR